MAVPKRRQSKARSSSRRAQWAAKRKPPTVVQCQKCENPMVPHRVCGACGFYGGKEIFPQEEA